MKPWDDPYQAHPSSESEFLRFLRERAEENELYELARDTRLAEWLLGGGLMLMGFVLLVLVIAIGG